MKKYIFKPYSSLFPKLFQQEKERILSHIKIPLIIEHIGSTAIPHLGGKGIIDIAIATDKKNLESLSKELQILGYLFRESFSTKERFYFIIYLPDPEEESRRYHIHLTYFKSKEWNDLIGFRDYLINNPELIQEYTEIKKQAALEANHNGDLYREIKDPMFKKVLSLIDKTTL
jgi:GrpB-like predicted nucleotidyltransferase (UPF0157 family)